jgi:cobaltochelatase CobS
MASEKVETGMAGDEGKIPCQICGKLFHRVDAHIISTHKMNTTEYRCQFPSAPFLSDHAKVMAEKARKGHSPKIAGKVKTSVSVEIPTVETPSATVVEDGVYQVGVARLRRVDTIIPGDEMFVPRFDEGWQVGGTEQDLLESLALAIEADEPALLVGPTGCGKNAMVDQLAAVLGQPITRINLHGDVRASDFLGEKRVELDPQSGQSVVVWKDGSLPRAMRNGHWLLLDELDAAPPSILFVLQSVLERGHRLVLTGNGGEVVVSHPRFRLVATANTLGRGDTSGLYAGTNVLNEAFLDRFGVVIQCSYPSSEIEIAILQARGQVHQDIAKRMVQVATKVREGMASEQCYCTFSTRRLIAWAIKAQRFISGGVDKTLAIGKAANLSVLNKLDGEDKKLVSSIIQRYFGGEV